ncbi:MAG: TatA/E family protein of Tat protein translocase [Lentimonas sp.]|jgi:TatA/E family protein of Tat protein translocase
MPVHDRFCDRAQASLIQNKELIMTSYSIAFIQNLNIREILLFVVILLIFFGAKRLPVLFHSIGKSITEFKRGIAADPKQAIEPIKETPKN